MRRFGFQTSYADPALPALPQLSRRESLKLAEQLQQSLEARFPLRLDFSLIRLSAPDAHQLEDQQEALQDPVLYASPAELDPEDAALWTEAVYLPVGQPEAVRLSELELAEFTGDVAQLRTALVGLLEDVVIDVQDGEFAYDRVRAEAPGEILALTEQAHPMSGYAFWPLIEGIAGRASERTGLLVEIVEQVCGRQVLGEQLALALVGKVDLALLPENQQGPMRTLMNQLKSQQLLGALAAGGASAQPAATISARARALLPDTSSEREWRSQLNRQHFSVGAGGSVFTGVASIDALVAAADAEPGGLARDDRQWFIKQGVPADQLQADCRYLRVQATGRLGLLDADQLPDQTPVVVHRFKDGAALSLCVAHEEPQETVDFGTLIIGIDKKTGDEQLFTAHPGLPAKTAPTPKKAREHQTLTVGELKARYPDRKLYLKAVTTAPARRMHVREGVALIDGRPQPDDCSPELQPVSDGLRAVQMHIPFVIEDENGLTHGAPGDWLAQEQNGRARLVSAAQARHWQDSGPSSPAP